MKRKPDLIYLVKGVEASALYLESRKQMLFLKKLVTNFSPHAQTDCVGQTGRPGGAGGDRQCQVGFNLIRS